MSQGDYQKLAECCPEGAEPLRIMADYVPKGEMVVINGAASCYVAWPKEGASRAVIVFQDIFGIHTGRHKQFCDMLAEKGFGAVAPDFTGKDPYIKDPPKFGASTGCALRFICGLCCGGFNRKNQDYSWDASIGPKVMGLVVPWIKEKGASKIAAAGFCWGSYGAGHCGRFAETFSCCAHFHPSTEGGCTSRKEDDLELMRKIKVPQFIVSTSMESAKWKPGGLAEKALTEDGTKCSWFYEEKEKHGFMMRADTSNADSLAAIKKWWEKMLEFYDENMPA